MTTIVEGNVTAATQNNLILGVRAKPLPAKVVAEVTEQAKKLIESAVHRYDKEIAAGEVGKLGTGRVSAPQTISDHALTGLLYGRVQSGKTAAMILASALSLDNGFRLVIVLTTNNLFLVRQTANRMKDVCGPLIYSTLKPASKYEWDGKVADLRTDLSRDGLVLVCAKQTDHVTALIELLQEIDAASVPAIIFDDEADAATPDTTTLARTSGGVNAPIQGSPIHRKVASNDAPGEEGKSIRETLPHHVFIQVTATPHVLFLQRETATLRPSFVQLLNSSNKYCGGNAFFEKYSDSIKVPEPPIVIVDSTEAATIQAANRGVPEGLAASCNFFLLAATLAASQSKRGFPKSGFAHLAHTSFLQEQHSRVEKLVSRHIRDIRHELSDIPKAARGQLSLAYKELSRTVNGLPPIVDLLKKLRSEITQAEVKTVNANTESITYGPRFNFIIGGNSLGRGITIDDLLVTYYLREAVTSQVDTMWQHARMYGYRDMQYTRLYITRQLCRVFESIYRAEEDLREVLVETKGDVGSIPIRSPARTRPTRPCAIEGPSLRVYGGRVRQIVPYKFATDALIISQSASQIYTLLASAGVPLSLKKRSARFTRVSVEVLKQLVDLLPVDSDDPGRWDPDIIRDLIDLSAADYDGHGHIWVRPLKSAGKVNARGGKGFLSGPELTAAANRGGFVLALTYPKGTGVPSAWYPMLVLPSGFQTYISAPQQ